MYMYVGKLHMFPSESKSAETPFPGASIKFNSVGHPLPHVVHEDRDREIKLDRPTTQKGDPASQPLFASS